MTTLLPPPGFEPQVPWNYDLFSTQFPEFSYRVSPTQAQMYWQMATMYHRNDGGGPIRRNDEQATMLNLLTAHIAELLAPGPTGPNGEPGEARGVVGRISSFNEGSAGGSAEYQGTQAAQWYLQTTYGSMYWEMTSSQRTAFYTVAPRRRFNTGIPFPFIGFGDW
jgi:hypothetical protein